MLEVCNIDTGYSKKQVLFDISVKIERGDIVLLAGSNGSGKSTLLKCIYGLLKPWNNGYIQLKGKDVTGRHPSEMLLKGMVYIPQKNNCFNDLSIIENLDISTITIKGAQNRKDKIRRILELFPQLSDIRNRKPFSLSGGERQLLSLGMALLHDPELILLDEPTAGLSPKVIDQTFNHIKEINIKFGITFLIVEHRIKDGIEIANKLLGLKMGKNFCFLENSELNNFELINKIFV